MRGSCGGGWSGGLRRPQGGAVRPEWKPPSQLVALVEGNGINATERITGVSKPTILKLLAEIGTVCADYQNRALRGLSCRRIQCDEIWQFCYAKAKNVPADKRGQFGYGDVWTWVALDADTKLVPAWLVAGRDLGSAYAFMHDLASRLNSRVQLTTDGYRLYLEAVESAFWQGIDYAMLHKIYGAVQEPDKRCGPAQCIGYTANPISGSPTWNTPAPATSSGRTSRCE